MPDQISQIDPANINMNVPDTNVAAPPPPPGVEKISLGEFENYQPTGQKPVMDGNKLAKEQPAIKKVETAAQLDTKENKQNVKAQKTTDVEVEVKDKGEVKTGEGEDEVDENADDKSTDTEGEDQTDSEESEGEGSEKVHGNSKRDYSGLSEQEIRVLKKLDNSRFSKIAPLIKGYKEAAGKSIQLATELESAKKLLKEGGVPESWHEHPEAYQLSREFQEINTVYGYQEQAENHYTQQLINIKQGKPWTPLQWNKATNSFEYGAQQDASDHGEAFVQKQIYAATSAKQALQVKSEGIRQNHASSYERAAQTMKQEVDNTIARMHPDAKPKPEDVALIERVIPQQYKNHPLYYAVSQLGAIILAQGKMNATLMKDQEQVTRLNQDIRKAGPAKLPPKRAGSPAKSESKDILRLSDFKSQYD